MQHQLVSVTPEIISQLLDAIDPEKGESLAQAVVRLRGARTAERVAKTEELNLLKQKLQDDSPIVGVALGLPTRSVLDDNQRADKEAEIASIASAEAALTACEHVAKHRDSVHRVEALIPEYKKAVRAFATQLAKTQTAYSPVEPLAEQLRIELGQLMNHSIGAGAASSLLPEPMDSSRLGASGEWREVFGSVGPNPSKLARWRSDFETWLSQ